ncbi:hypothetical protein BDA99DRAFT_217405 [Phascolomyces articulosus]|uniref:3'-5' exonuclease n=1 Tax=Phascolomyces articulosus TaxID=60185 RepID=A0AAD5JQN7_9FUNG|nr:hypothetical protein BDA99DRAFT_217405 [Phascolomyces articulosus]
MSPQPDATITPANDSQAIPEVTSAIAQNTTESPTVTSDNIAQEDSTEDNYSGLGNLINNLEVEHMDPPDIEGDPIIIEDGDDNVENDENYNEAPFLKTYFSEVQKRVLKSFNGKQRNEPKEYANKSFWIEPPSPFFALRIGHSNPTELYKPRIFLWVPHLLASKPLKCTCKSTMVVKSFNDKPHARRVVDIDRCFYIMSIRYKCSNDKCTVTMNAHDDHVLSQLPEYLQAEFPAYLTHRCAVSKLVGDLLRASVQNGMGINRVQAVLREFHNLRYAKLHLQYLDSLKHRQTYPTHEDLIDRRDPKFQYAPFSAFDDRNGYAGYIPSAGYLRNVYTSMIDQLRPLIDKELMILGGLILKGDHSFKVPNHMAKLGGSAAFTALYTICNEYEEIRMQLLVPTKALVHIEGPLKEMISSYKFYGHPEPELFFTDNVKGDQGTLERTITSLKQPIDQLNSDRTSSINQDTSDTIYLELPDHVSVHLIDEYSCIPHAVQSICNYVQGPRRQVVVGFDCEWKFNPITYTTGKVSLVQVACKNDVWLFRINTTAPFPASLSSLIEDPSILKVGRNVKGDLKKLQRDYRISWNGALELGSFCRRRGAIGRGTLGLSAICVAVLGGALRKDNDVRLSDWENHSELSQTQIKYAALDAWASFKVFDSVKEDATFNEQIQKSANVGLYCSLQYSGIPVAFGQFTGMGTKEGEENEALFTVNKVNVPGAVVYAPDKDKDKDIPQALSDFGSVPFVIKVPVVYLYTEKPSLCQLNGSNTSTEITVTNNQDISTQSQPIADPDSQTDLDEDAALSSESEDENDVTNRITVNTIQHASSEPSGRLPNFDDGQYNNQSNAKAPNPRILKDIFHLMDMIKVSKRHGLAKEFARRLRDAIFIVDPEDKDRIKTYLESNGLTWNYMMTKNPAWVLRRCKRYVPKPEELYAAVQNLFAEYGELRCIRSNRPLFDQVAWQQARRVLEAIRFGEVSDPPDISLYFQTGVDRNGFPLYRCSRGTNSLEGGVHQNIIRKFSTFGAGPHLTDCALADYRLRHNINVGMKNRYGKVHKGHYSPWITQTICHLMTELNIMDKAELVKSLVVKDALYMRMSNETFGIAAFPEVIADELQIKKVDYHKASTTISDPSTRSDPLLAQKISSLLLFPAGSTNTKKGRLYDFIASRLSTKYAVTPVHTQDEFNYFNEIMEINSSPTKADWKNICKSWNNNKADGKNIFTRLQSTSWHITMHGVHYRYQRNPSRKTRTQLKQ